MLNAYSVYDRKALTYMPPFFCNTDGQAVRMLSDIANDPQHPIGAHPSDYVLYAIGTYSDADGKLEPVAPLRHVMDAIALVKLQPALFTPPAPLDTDLSMLVNRNGKDPV